MKFLTELEFITELLDASCEQVFGGKSKWPLWPGDNRIGPPGIVNQHPFLPPGIDPRGSGAPGNKTGFDPYSEDGGRPPGFI